ncbi:hypothetical protein BST63_03600 [Bradyrhizobium canariense]|uniref:Uncharacterized protein n=1 Tax=Bradyrhizobium canariense TaxID=255045 RepID=A0ABX3XB93_9BRAD|nr:hypothetical protein [Bradyrhizobium canariense]OSJ19207.1 hypothetical protein BSR47_03970 [Bradyrhizobium canariense]OSJ34461.1 hypothetical protein BST63_03600 [Bradyrhizobium canariense]
MHSPIKPIYPGSQIRSPALSPEDVELVARADERLAHAYDQIARADEQLARVNEQLSKLDQDGTRHPSQPKNSAKWFRPPDRGASSLRGRPALRGLIGLLLASGICVAALAAQSSDGDAVRAMMYRWSAHAVSPSSLPQERAEISSALPTTQTSATYVALQQPGPLTTPHDAIQAAAPSSPELALQGLSGDLTNPQQVIEQLKASQDQIVRDLGQLSNQLTAVQAQMVRDRADAAEQLRMVQERLAGITTNASEQILRPKTPMPLPRPIAATIRKPAPTVPRPQDRGRPHAPLQTDQAVQD